MELKWITKAHSQTANNLIIESIPFEYDDYCNQYNELAKDEKSKYKGIDNYIEAISGFSLRPTQINYRKLEKEIRSNIDSEEFNTFFPIDMFSDSETIMDLLGSLENTTYIKNIYKIKKKTFNGSLKEDTTTKIMDSFRQGRKLLLSAKNANMLSKPLIDFYAASAYAYASIVINSPIHKSFDSLKGSHGHSYNHKDGTIVFGGDCPSGTFIDLLISNYLPQVVFNDDVQFKYSALPSLEFVQKNSIQISLLALLSTVPELQGQVLSIENSKRQVYKLKIESSIKNKKVAFVFTIGDGKNKPEKNSLVKPFNLNGESEIEDVDGKYRITIHSDSIESIMPTIYQDLKGELWYIDPLIPSLYIPEACLHFLIISALCNIMRYSPFEWNNILSNRISSEFSLLISKYLHLFELKYPMLIVEQLTVHKPILL